MHIPHRLCLLVAGALTFASARADGQTLLRFQFKEGDKLGYVLDQKMKMTTNVGGKDIEVNMTQWSEMDWKVLKVVEKESAQIQIDISSVKMSLDGPMGKIEIDSKNMKEQKEPVGAILNQVVQTMAGMEIKLTMNNRGQIKDIVIPEKVKESLKNLPGAETVGDLFSDDNIKKMVNTGISFPKEPVEKGASEKGTSWKENADLKLPMGRFKGEMEFTYEGPVEKDGQKLEKILITPTFRVEPGPDAPFQMKFRKQSGHGHIYFDNAAGKIVDVDMDQQMDITIESNNTTIEQKTLQITRMKPK